MQTKRQHQVQKSGNQVNIVSWLSDEQGKVISGTMKFIEIAIQPKDVMQMFFGSLLFASQFFLSHDVLEIGRGISNGKALALFLITVAFASLFIYFHGFSTSPNATVITQFIARVVTTVVVSTASLAAVLIFLNLASLDNNASELFRILAILSLPGLFGAVTFDLIGSERK